jgi:hypothetical protein
MIQLPKDAEGREIPLDTKVLYGSGGTARNIVYWVYTVDSDLEKEWGNCWRAVTDAGRKLDPELMYLTEPDSWEKLEEDLGKIANHQTEVVCPYYDREIKDCEGCKLEGYDCSCSHAFLKDVMARIRKLRGED